MTAPLLIKGRTVHARRGAVGHVFRYSVDYVLIDPDDAETPALFSRNRFNLFAVHDRNHGGARGKGQGARWARAQFAQAGLSDPYDLRLLTQPSFLGYLFNPVSFWIAQRQGDLLAVIAEVNNTFGDRHSYLCHHPGFAPIQPGHRITAQKLMHVSPFQQIAGLYHFNFTIAPDKIAIRIYQENGDEGVIATFNGDAQALTSAAVLWSSICRPFGALRTIALIYWQALRLKLKGASYRTRPSPPTQEVSSCSSSPTE